MKAFKKLSQLTEFHGWTMIEFVRHFVSARHGYVESHPRYYLANQVVWSVGDLVEKETSKRGKTRSGGGLERHPSAPNDVHQPIL